MAVTYSVQISDADYRALCWKTANPNQYIDDRVTFFINEMKKEFIKEVVKAEIDSPRMRTISADSEELISQVVIKSAKQRDEEETKRMQKFVENPDDPIANRPSPPNMYLP